MALWNYVQLLMRGINVYRCLILADMHNDIKSCISHVKLKSCWFYQAHGVRQDSVLSALSYLVYNNDLLDKVDISDLGTVVIGFKIDCAV